MTRQHVKRTLLARTCHLRVPVTFVTTSHVFSSPILGQVSSPIRGHSSQQPHLAVGIAELRNIIGIIHLPTYEFGNQGIIYVHQ